MILLQNTPKKQSLPQIRQQRALVRGINLRTNANVLSPTAFQARKAYMVSAYQEGKFLADPEARGKPRPNPMSDPAAMEGMMGMMKGNMAMMIPQTLIMGWINAFFSGFVISKSESIRPCQPPNSAAMARRLYWLAIAPILARTAPELYASLAACGCGPIHLHSYLPELALPWRVASQSR